MADTPNNIVKFLTAICGPVQDVENALQQLFTQRSIDAAVGSQLDVLGEIVGQPREGLADTDYRRYIKARIAAHRSGGVPEDIIRVASLVLGLTTTGVLIIRDIEDASCILEVSNFTVDLPTSTALRQLVNLAASAGVRIVLVYSNVLLASTFRFDTGPGWDQGHLARALDPAGTP